MLIDSGIRTSSCLAARLHAWIPVGSAWLLREDANRQLTNIGLQRGADSLEIVYSNVLVPVNECRFVGIFLFLLYSPHS